MEILFKEETIKALIEAGVKSSVFHDNGDYLRDKEIDTKYINKSDYEIIKRVVRSAQFSEHIANRRILKKLEAVEKLASADTSSTKISKLDLLAEALTKVMRETPHKWMFMTDDSYGSLVPYFVDEIKYHPPRAYSGGYTAAHTTIKLSAVARGQDIDKTVTFHKDDLPGTVESVLRAGDIFIETPETVADYESEMRRYSVEAPRTGEQYLARGPGVLAGESRWHRESVIFDKDGEPSKVIMDDALGQGKEAGVASMLFWETKHVSRDEREDEPEKVVSLPVHPIVRVFSLLTHEYVDCHISGIDSYVYDSKIVEKLVLPEDQKELIDALTGSAIKRMSDIVTGKAQGIIVTCSGKPGTGKTLTAEVYSEAAKRPLYTVQCSQLGTDADELEKRLGEVLGRATRWKAILLIDEADVYIHERGSDIGQNAIVGVFLRLLEYYNGILFMTTNRATIIDDAILSRATAHIRYDVPQGNDRLRIWQVLAKQYGVDGSLNIQDAVKAFPKISGRSIRQLIRLAKIMADRQQKPITVQMLEWAAKFHDFSELDEVRT